MQGEVEEMNNFKVEIYDYNTSKWQDYSAYAVFPTKSAEMLDEQLDEAELSLKRIKDKYFYPMTKVRVTYINKPNGKYSSPDKILERASSNVEQTYNANIKQITQTKVLNMLVASDNAIEFPVGSGRYNHDIYLIERTKLLEGYMGEALSFTNPLSNEYLKSGALADYREFNTNEGEFTRIEPPYKSCITTGENAFVQDIYKYIGWKPPAGLWVETSITIKEQDSTVLYQNTFQNTNPPDVVLNIKNLGQIVVELTFTGLVSKPNGDVHYSARLDFYIQVIENHLPLKKWAIKTVVERIFDCIEPLKEGQTPRFRLAPETAQKLDKIISPEFNLSQMNLREQLKQVGSFIHGEPRIVDEDVDNDGFFYYIVDFDFYGGKEYSNIKNLPYVSATLGTSVNEYCTGLDSSVNNLINQLDWAVGVITEPFIGGGKSLRSETTAVRLGEDNSTVISTQFPIYQVKKIVCTKVNDNGEIKTGRWDITPFIFEYADYSNLSSYKGSYPYSKSYGIYYTQGEKNIKGLFFKPSTASDIEKITTRYSIINILKTVTGFTLNTKQDVKQYYEFSFEVTYLPLYSTRVKTNKALVINGMPRTLAYNQSASIVEARYYGENLKGAVARMGNVEKTYTYNLGFLSDIPKVGTLFDDNYYISTVSTGFLPTYIKCTIGLSKDFNRLSQYVGINSNKRMYEISEKQAYERDRIQQNFLLISKDKQDSDSGILNSYLERQLAGLVLNSMPAQVTIKQPISAVRFIPYNKNGNKIKQDYAIVLPVVSTALGNSMVFCYGFDDNYSAGQKIEFVTDADYTGYWGEYVNYTDYYGRFHYYSSTFLTTKEPSEQNKSILSFASGDTTENLPQGTLTGYEVTPDTKYLYRKDSREIPTFNFELTAVTDIENLVIGSALMKNCALVNTNPREYILIGLNERVNTLSSKFDCSVDDNGNTVITNGAIINKSIEIDGNKLTIPAVGNYKAWALITKPTITTIDVEDEDGVETKQYIQDGGEVILAMNNIKNEPTTLYFAVKQRIYDKTYTPKVYTMTVTLNRYSDGELKYSEEIVFTTQGAYEIEWQGYVSTIDIIGDDLSFESIGNDRYRIVFNGTLEEDKTATINVYGYFPE